MYLGPCTVIPALAITWPVDFSTASLANCLHRGHDRRLAARLQGKAEAAHRFGGVKVSCSLFMRGFLQKDRSRFPEAFPVSPDHTSRQKDDRYFLRHDLDPAR
jgi:hypothetical protein